MNGTILAPNGGRRPAKFAVGLATAVATLVLFGLSALASAQSSYVASVEGESMTESDSDIAIANDSGASGGKYLEWTGPGSATKKFTPSAGGQDLKIKARVVGDPNAGVEWPSVSVKLDSTEIFNETLTNTSWVAMDTDAGSVSASSHTLSVETTGGMGANQELHLDLFGVPAAPAPDPGGNSPVECQATNAVKVTPTQDLVSVAKNNPAGTTFCLADGTYTLTAEVPVQTGDKFVGAYSDGSRPIVQSNGKISWTASKGVQVTGGSQQKNIFSQYGASDTLLKGLEVRGAAHDNSCEPRCGRGSAYGNGNNDFEDVKMTLNEYQGIGNPGDGSEVRNSILSWNGNYDGGRDGGPVGDAGIKSGNDFRIVNSDLVDNYWIGAWCDTNCENMTVDDSDLSRNGKAGVSHEIASGDTSYVRNSTLQDNGKGIDGFETSRAAIMIVGSRTMEVSGNTFGNNNTHAVIARDDLRGGDGHNLYDINIFNNTLNGDTINGCSDDGVTCSDNTAN